MWLLRRQRQFEGEVTAVGVDMDIVGAPVIAGRNMWSNHISSILLIFPHHLPRTVYDLRIRLG